MASSEKATEDKRKANLFVFNIVIIYALWKAFAYFVKSSSGTAHDAWLNIIRSLGVAYASVASFILNLFGENTVQTGISVFFPVYNKLMRIEDHCLAIPATVIFIGSILSFTGRWQNKLWFVSMGIVLIVLINLTRVVLVCYIFAHYTRSYYEINHSVVYVVITYTLIFLLIIWWMRSFSGFKKKLDQ
jgi:exosortase/archaeosortase family protein